MNGGGALGQAMKGTRGIKLRRHVDGSTPEFSPRRAEVAHQRANYFFPAQGGGGARKGGGGLWVEVSLRHSGKKTVY